MKEGTKVLAAVALVALGVGITSFDACARGSGTSPVPDVSASPAWVNTGPPRAAATPEPPRAPAPSPPRDRNEVTAGDFGDEWPLTVDRGVLTCVPFGAGIGAVIFTAGGTSYAVNGTAKSSKTMARYNLHDVKEIWRQQPGNSQLRVNIGPLIDRGRALCQ